MRISLLSRCATLLLCLVVLWPAGCKKQPADFAQIFQIINKANYRGYVTLEYEETEPHTRMPTYIRQLQNLSRQS